MNDLIAKYRRALDLYRDDGISVPILPSELRGLLDEIERLSDQNSSLLATNYDLRKERDRMTDELAEARAVADEYTEKYGATLNAWMEARNRIAVLEAALGETALAGIESLNADQPTAVECPECFGRGKRNLSDGSWMRCDYCDGKGTTADKSGVTVHVCRSDCTDGADHSWDGPLYVSESDGLQSATCSKCGMTAFHHSMMTGE